ncbi:Ferrous iron permease EfeU [Clostridium liquoris]|jgi:high-affinity iron transporter|uniref:Ferrous iron permease EfeU n=1 Tax=Clostridium liquoris TaxID=1289519 RepID=A0A2T0B0K0_9CLOT|nr:FTR1 family protein [Clostridium liquoris]PRR77073.1 Ferrous iron permease EfeU [Clostridium liquoris]
MIIPMTITFRESLEMLLIIVPLLVYLNKMDRTDLSKYIYGGCISGALASVLVGKILISTINTLEGPIHQLFLGSMMIFLAALILYSIVLVSKDNKNLTLNITEKYDVKLKGFSLFLLSFITIFRESLEIVIFLLPLALADPLNIILGVVLGILLSLALAYIIFKSSIKLNIYIIFVVLTLILIIIGGYMTGEGLALLFPAYGKSVELLGKLIFTIPLLYIFLKRELRKYLKK